MATDLCYVYLIDYKDTTSGSLKRCYFAALDIVEAVKLFRSTFPLDFEILSIHKQFEIYV